MPGTDCAVVHICNTGNKGTTAFCMYQLYNIFLNSLWYRVSSILSNTGGPISIAVIKLNSTMKIFHTDH